tara:strand:- start:2469 stop:2654 length:186 start_codon:yes stop_codon:yes gene_type:complete
MVNSRYHISEERKSEEEVQYNLSGSKHRILVADDEMYNQHAIKFQLMMAFKAIGGEESMVD